MNNVRIELIDIADDLLIMNKQTIDTLMRLDNCADCIALYVFYYKTAKWQKTNQIKANDEYVKRSLKWGREKIVRTKKTLKEYGLIDIIQERKDGKISAWYIKVSYIVQKKKIEDCHIITENNKYQNQQVEKPTSNNQEVNALKEKIKCLNEEIEMLKKRNMCDAEDNCYDLIIGHLNKRIGTRYRSTTGKTKALIKSRLNEGFTVDDFIKVIDIKTAEWMGTEWEKFLRPETLFGTKFEGYLNQKQIRREFTNQEIAAMLDEAERRDHEQNAGWTDAGESVCSIPEHSPWDG